MLKLKLQYFGLLMQFIGKDPNARKDWGQEKRAAENEMVREQHWLNGREFEQTPGDGEGQGSLLCYSPVCGVAKSQTRPSDWTTTIYTIDESSKVWYSIHSSWRAKNRPVLSSELFIFWLFWSVCVWWGAQRDSVAPPVSDMNEFTAGMPTAGLFIFLLNLLKGNFERQPC